MMLARIKKHYNQTINLFIVLAVSIGFIAYQFREVPLGRVWSGIQHAKVQWLVVGIVVMVSYWFLESFVLYLMAKKVHKEQTFWQSFRVTMVGQFFNTITPFASGGQPAQLYMLKKNGVSVGVGSSVLLMKFIVFQSMLVLSSAGILVFGYRFLENQSIPQVNTLILIGFIVNLIVILLLLVIAKNKEVGSFIVRTVMRPVAFFVKKERYNKWEDTLNQKLVSFHEESNRMSFNRSLLLQCSVLTIIQLILFFSIPYFVTQALAVSSISIFRVISYHSFIFMFASLVPIPGGSGGAEYSFSLLFGMLLSPTKLVLCLFFWRLITYYSCIIFGSFFLMKKPSK